MKTELWVVEEATRSDAQAAMERMLWRAEQDGALSMATVDPPCQNEDGQWLVAATVRLREKSDGDARPPVITV